MVHLVRRCLHTARAASASSFSSSSAAATPPPRLRDGNGGGGASNVPERVKALLGRRLHLQQHHPLHTVKTAVFDFFAHRHVSGAADAPRFELYDELDPVVTVAQCFDELLVPPEHVSRSPSDTFYVDATHVLRAHTSAHQTQLLRRGADAFLVAGDCYRRDEIDAHHYPCFHQLEGVQLFDGGGGGGGGAVVAHLQHTLETLVQHVFAGSASDMRWVDAYFPFTQPSFELEVLFRGEWMEVLGCGAIHRDILRACGVPHKVGWAFGIGLERLAMALFDIPDIRLFWSRDPRFLRQFPDGQVRRFKPFSRFPACYKDVSAWLPPAGAPFADNDFYALVGDIAGDLVESVEVIDEFRHPHTGRVSKCFRLNYRSMERSLTNAEVDALQRRVRDAAQRTLHLELR